MTPAILIITLIVFLIVQSLALIFIAKKFFIPDIEIELPATASIDPSSVFDDIKSKIASLESNIKVDVGMLEKKVVSLDKSLAKIPSKTLNTIQGSVNNTSGKLGEMMALLEIQQTYDRIIISNDIVDFIGIRFPKDGDSGCIHFIDVKTGKSASLSSDQRKLRDMFPKELNHFAFKIVKTQVT